MADLSLAAAFVAGLASFLSPCVAPLVPGYLTLISGAGFVETGRAPSPRRTALAALVFVAGFSLVFITLGVTASSLGSVLDLHRQALTRLAGVFMLLMGLFVTGALQLPWLYRERRFHPPVARALTRSETLLLGMAFGFGWTPCIGPLLASILVYTSAAATVGRGTVLLGAYSLGLALPFLAVGLGIGRATAALRWVARHSRSISLVSGATLILFGVLLLSGRVFYVSLSAQRLYERIGTLR